MGLLSFSLSRPRRLAPAAEDADMLMISHSKPCDPSRERETRLSFSELIAASSLLDFGGMLDERWLSGRAPEERGADRCLK